MKKATKAKYTKDQPARGCILRFPRALIEVSRVSVPGTEKHGVPLDDLSYLDLPDADTLFVEAELRHMLAPSLTGTEIDPDFGLAHKAHKAWNALADLEVYLRNKEMMDERAPHPARVFDPAIHPQFFNPDKYDKEPSGPQYTWTREEIN